MRPINDAGKQIRFANFVTPDDLFTATLAAQQEATMIRMAGEFPEAQPPAETLFSTFADKVQVGLSTNPPSTPSTTRESHIWRLSSILFDPLPIACADFIAGVPEDRIEEFAQRMRMDALGAFWSELVSSQVAEGLKRAKTAEEKALVYLTLNDIVSACEVLMGAGDYKLAALVAQLPASETSRAMMKGQIEVWRERHDWSEFSDPVRAFYSLLAGEVCVVPGVRGAAEDRVSEFAVAERFGMSWEQSFGLRLYFGGHESVEQVVQAYMLDMEAGKEVVPPTVIWPDLRETRSSLIGILGLVADGEKEVGALFEAKAVSGGDFNSRLSWQMACLLRAREVCGVEDEKMDVLTLDFATELEAAGRLVDGVWVLLHLKDETVRTTAVDRFLDRNCGHISTPGQDERGTFEDLQEICRVPAPMLWKAKALYAQSVLENPALQTQWLLNAGLVDEAHKVLCTTLGPQAVIEQDYTTLSHILDAFPARMSDDWKSGGQVYMDFVRMVKARQAQSGAGSGLGKLRQRLRNMGDKAKSLEERVAVVEMERVVGEVMREEGEVGRGGRKGTAGKSGVGLLERYQRAMGVAA
jgi:nuclear pore complex protein Nup98-Nup96